MRNTTLVEIRVSGHKAQEAATIANEIANVYQSRHKHSGSMDSATDSARVEIVDTARPAPRPISPNRPLNLLIGALAGVLLGIVGGVGGVRYASRKEEFGATAWPKH